MEGITHPEELQSINLLLESGFSPEIISNQIATMPVEGGESITIFELNKDEVDVAILLAEFGYSEEDVIEWISKMEEGEARQISDYIINGNNLDGLNNLLGQIYEREEDDDWETDSQGIPYREPSEVPPEYFGRAPSYYDEPPPRYLSAPRSIHNRYLNKNTKIDF